MKLIFIRHGDPDYENDSLTEKGKREAVLLAQKVKEINPDYVYSSPLGRAELTCKYSKEVCGFDYEVLPWLHEFKGRFIIPETGKRSASWDLLPSYYTSNEILLDNVKWREFEPFKESNVLTAYDEAAAGLDELLKKHGYLHQGNIYKAVRSNRDTIVFFCHFAITAALMGHLTGFSPYVFWQNFCALPTSITTFVTEEREEGIASFRCCGFGEVGHLTEHGEPASFAARFCETFDSDERH